MDNIIRRPWGKMTMAIATLIAVMATSILTGCDGDKNNLYIYTWADYIDPELVSEFEKSNDCKVVISTFDSNESMYAKLMAGGVGYDIIMPTEYVMPLLISSDLVDRLDIGNLPNVSKNFDETFASEWSLKWDVPYAFSFTGILWRKDKVPADLAFTDWNDMFDERLKGRICMMDDIREVLGIGLLTLGFSANTIDQGELAKAVKLARKWKSVCARMDNEAYRSGIPSGEFHVAMSYNSDAMQLIADGADNLGYAIPTNGTTSSIDVMCVLKGAKNKELAYKFMDMLYDVGNAVRNSEYNGSPMPVKGLFDNLSDEYKAFPFMKVDAKLKSCCEDIRDVGSAIWVYNRAWDEVKSTKEQTKRH